MLGNHVRLSVVPETRRDFWEAKLLRNRERDQKVGALLEAMGWRVVRLWECEFGNSTDNAVSDMMRMPRLE